MLWNIQSRAGKQGGEVTGAERARGVGAEDDRAQRHTGERGNSGIPLDPRGHKKNLEGTLSETKHQGTIQSAGATRSDLGYERTLASGARKIARAMWGSRENHQKVSRV